LDLYVILYDFVTWPEAHVETASDFYFHRQIILKNFLQNVKDVLGVNLAMSKCDGYNPDKDAEDRAKEHMYFVDNRVSSSMMEHMIDSLAAKTSPEALLECLHDASNYIFDEIHGGASSVAERVLLNRSVVTVGRFTLNCSYNFRPKVDFQAEQAVDDPFLIHRPMPIVLNATFYDKMQSLKLKFNLRTILAVNDYQRDNLTIETFTNKMAEYLKIDQVIFFDGREDSAINFIRQFWLALKNPPVEQVSRKAIDCIV
uniref:Uncharacterized protein n=1 Tax=Romanomermis culicivorax TaxID=13658 RepID=A0A915JKS1_ROMCU